MILDAGALIAVSRNDRAMIARLVAAEQDDEEVSTHPMVVAQVWRDGGRQVVLARLLRGVQIVVIDDELGRRCGGLLGKAKTSDPIDAAVVLIASDGESVVTSDPDDIEHLARVARRKVIVVRC
ncbi:MAG TPA: hypothetical protein VHT91_36645 [Kofleriaceae bacterium]|jgi:predicted nucleic acid-binding protein|nr:hypothetical protein [Kofleriaceae bacterium]